MSTAQTTLEHTTQGWSYRRLAIVGSMIVALVAGLFAAYSLTVGSEPAITTAPETAVIEDVRVGSNNCAQRHDMSGGPLPGGTYPNTCGEPGGRTLGGGVQP